MSRRADEFFAVIPEWIIYHPDVTSRAVHLYAILRRHADDSGHAWPSRTRLAALMGCSRDTVDRTLKVLEDVDAVTVERRRDNAGDPTTNLYTVHVTRGGSRTDAATGSRADAQGGSRTDAALNQSHVEPEPLEPEKRPLARRDRDLLWEMFVQVHGEPSNKTERGKYNKAVGLLREADVAPDEYPALVAAYTSKHDGLQPGVMTVPTRVGELRQYARHGPVTADEFDRQRRIAYMEAKLEEQKEQENDAIGMG